MKQLIIIFLTVIISSNALAQSPDILPGLWENQIEMSSKSGQIEAALAAAKQALANMPPEMRKMTEDMMAQRGIKMDFGNASVQTCITKEDIDNFDFGGADDDCTQSFDKTSANTYALTVSCPDQNAEGKGEFVINSNKQYTGTSQMDLNMQGQADTITTKVTGTWLSADCGNIN